MWNRYNRMTALAIITLTVLFWLVVGMIITKPSIRYYEDSSVRITMGSYSTGYCVPFSYCSNH
jgi:hypothetical protein